MSAAECLVPRTNISRRNLLRIAAVGVPALAAAAGPAIPASGTTPQHAQRPSERSAVTRSSAEYIHVVDPAWRRTGSK
jgi:hypothetical protein